MQAYTPPNVKTAGAIGQALEKQLVRSGVNVILSNSRGPDTLTAVVDQLG